MAQTADSTIRSRHSAAARRRTKRGDTLTGQTGVNRNALTKQGSAPNQQVSTSSGSPSRFGKRFKIALDKSGRIVHLYGNDVPAAQRRIVMGPPKKGLAPKKTIGGSAPMPSVRPAGQVEAMQGYMNRSRAQQVHNDQASAARRRGRRAR